MAVVFPDLTRPMPNRTVLPPLLAELARAGVPDDRITLLCATGTHRQASESEMEELVGPDIVARYAIVDHDGTSDAHVAVGEVDGTAVLLQREYVEADLRIVTGFVEPHFFAGFSGGPKAVCPGLAANTTILEAHHPRRIADARATFVTREGNPVHDFVRAAVALAPPHLSLDVAINRARQVTAVFAGPLPAAHDAACAHVQSAAVRAVDAPFDLVVSTNGGFPLDRNLYQAVKGMAAAERIVRPGRHHRHGGGLRRRRARRRRLRPPAGRRLAHRPISSGHPVRPSSTAGRPRCSGASSTGPMSCSSPMASVGTRRRARSSRWRPTSTARLRRPWVASGPGPGWPSCPKARSRWRRSAPQADDAALPRQRVAGVAVVSCGPHRQTDA